MTAADALSYALMAVLIGAGAAYALVMWVSLRITRTPPVEGGDEGRQP